MRTALRPARPDDRRMMDWIDDLIEGALDVASEIVEDCGERWRELSHARRGRRAHRREERRRRQELRPLPPGATGAIVIRSNGLAPGVEPPSGALEHAGPDPDIVDDAEVARLALDALQAGRPVMRPDDSVLAALDENGQWRVLLRTPSGWRRA